MFTDMAAQMLKPLATEPQYNVMRILAGQNGNPVTVQEIQERMIQKSSNVTRIIDKLVEKGWVNRSICEENRRKMDITITRMGLEDLKLLDKKVHKTHAPYQGRLTTEEIKTLNQLLTKLNTAP